MTIYKGFYSLIKEIIKLICHLQIQKYLLVQQQFKPTHQRKMELNEPGITIIQNQQNKNKPNQGQVAAQQKICQFWIARKKRSCKFAAANGSKFCHAHCSDLQNKIQCPYEKGMFIDKAKYQKHLQNCPRIRDKNKQKKSIWYNQSINKNNQEVNIMKDNQPKESLKNSTIQSQFDKNIKQIQITELPKALKQIPENQKMIGKIIQLYFDCFQGKQEHFIESTQKESLLQTTNDHMQAQLITQKAHAFGLISDKHVYVQFGAGKGILSYAIAKKVKQLTDKNSKNILLQRQVRRNKFDRFFKQNPYFQRYKSDVSDFDFGLLPKTMAEYAKVKCNIQNTEQVQKQLQESHMIGVCKHMCGQALDISVRGLLKANCKGNILASCCHHLCNYSTYLNPKFFKQKGWTPQQTQTMFKMSSWGTKAHEFSKDDIKLQKLQQLYNIYGIHKGEQSKQMFVPSTTQKIIIGRMCKRLIDFGRAQFLGGKLHRYCSDQLTPQNYVIISG